MSEIWVAGEALIDLVPDHNGVHIPIVGGGPANTAKALALLGLHSVFIDGISHDFYGEMIMEELRGAGVDLSRVLRSSEPTALAKVTLDSLGAARYEFTLDKTATFAFQQRWLPRGEPDLLHIGTLATIIEPGASELFVWANQLDVPIVFDPNVRPSVVGDRFKYREAVERWIEISDAVKLSDDDLFWLYPEAESFSDLIEVAKKMIELGPDLVVITRGADGLVGVRANDVMAVPGVSVEVVDTVGAGDTVGAILVEGIAKYGLSEALSGKLEGILMRAAKAAAITCSRAGARPPTAFELL